MLRNGLMRYLSLARPQSAHEAGGLRSRAKSLLQMTWLENPAFLREQHSVVRLSDDPTRSTHTVEQDRLYSGC